MSKKSIVSNVHGVLKTLLLSLFSLLDQNNHLGHDGSKKISHETRVKRVQVLVNSFCFLHKSGYKLKYIDNISVKHMKCLITHWLDKELSASTLQNNLSIFRTFFTWLNRHGYLEMVISKLEPEQKVLLETRIKRKQSAQKDLSWEGNGFDPNEKIEEIAATDIHVAIQLGLQLAFGLRSQEAMLLRPHIADRGHTLAVVWGTKGKRPRDSVAINTEAQRQILEMAKALCETKISSSIPKKYSLRQWRYHYYYVVRKHGIRRDAGVTAHGLRHGFAQARFEALAKHPAFVKFAKRDDDVADDAMKDDIALAKAIVAEELGHSRPQITDAYVGSENRVDEYVAQNLAKKDAKKK